MVKRYKITQRQIADKFGVSQYCVSLAVRYKRNSKLARDIRKAYGKSLMRIGTGIKTAAKTERKTGCVLKYNKQNKKPCTKMQ